MIPIIIVEDEFLVRVGLKSLVDWNSYGFYIAGDASNGQEGFALYQKHHPYLIITDIRMSPVSGLEMMHKIRSMDPDVKFIIISAYNDFSYAQQAISYGVELYLSKSTFKNQDLAQILPKIHASYKSKYGETKDVAASVLLGFDAAFPDIAHPEAISRQLKKDRLHTGPRYILASRFDRSEPPACGLQMHKTILQNLLERAQIPFQLYTRKDFLLCLCQTKEELLLMQLSREAHDTLLNYTLSPCFFGISSMLEQNQQLFRAVSESCLACNEFILDKTVPCRIFSVHSTVLDYDNLNLDISMEELMSSVFSSRREETLFVLEKIMFSCRNYRSLERAIFTVLFSFIEYDNSDTLSSLLERFLKKDDLTRIILSLRDWIYSLPFNTLPTGGSANEYVEAVVNYIKRHLEDPLSIQSLAEMIHLSPNYLGKIFYQNTGAFISQYITSLRMNRACDLLRQTDLPINTVGAMVGISNPHYFSRLFRDTFGTSPSKYRMQPSDK